MPHSFQLNKAVLFLVFNRLNTTRRVFEVIRKAQPPRLYVAADGPRRTNSEDQQKVTEVRSFILSSIDWDCEIHTLFRPENLGCKYAVSDAISWFFRNEKEGIILEDDCLPNLDFFRFCEWALNMYREDLRVWHVNGNNFAAPAHIRPVENVSFSALAQVWGWATWRDRWVHYKSNPHYLWQRSWQKFRHWNISQRARANELRHIMSLQNGVDTWDYQWQITVLNHAGMCLSCRFNLISNIGDDEDATHTQNDKRTHLDTSDIQGTLEYEAPRLNSRLSRWYEKKMGLTRVRKLVRVVIYLLLKKLNSITKDFLAAILFRGMKPIVIASTGRCGSSMLKTAITESFVRQRYRVKPSSWFGKVLTDSAATFTARVADISLSRIPVHKTHGLLPAHAQFSGKFIFIYGDPLDSALSVQKAIEKSGTTWFERHLYNLESTGSPGELFEKDILNYEKQIESWVENARDTVLQIRYEELWDKQDELNKYLGFEVTLPAKCNRSQKTIPESINEDLFRHLRSLTGS